jgi:hypothetical protein
VRDHPRHCHASTTTALVRTHRFRVKFILLLEVPGISPGSSVEDGLGVALLADRAALTNRAGRLVAALLYL